ncbi:hypothetical protein C7271_01270 [filamentous cyanobacterium CCP5]|nr:hypothetical protein C7271_01270 [filamentous cyanobacterium CCP5]
MNTQTVNTTLSAQEALEIVNQLKLIREQLPFLVGLTPQERRQLPKMGRKSQTFTTRALDMAVQHVDMMPRHLDVEEARRDLALFEALNPILQAVNHLKELLEDTQMVAGSEAYAAARLAYNSAKVTGKNRGIDDVLEELSQQFRKSRRPAAIAETTTP